MSSLEVVEFSALASKPQPGTLQERVVEALGGAGMIAVHNVPGVEQLRRELLPLARALALMPDAERKLVLKENGLGTDVPLKRPERPVSSFAAQLRFSDTLTSQEASIGSLFRKLGECLVEVGTLVARVCDTAMAGLELERSILDAQTAKGRLIHYHSDLERRISSTTSEGSEQDGIWQQWHYDYGVLTLVTGPMFLSGREEVDAPSGHSGLMAMNRGEFTGVFVRIPESSVLVQVGEAAQIFSGGKLRATAHCVLRPSGTSPDVSRETFVVFLQPAWDRELKCEVGGDVEEVEDEFDESGSSGLEMIPPLKQRWKPGWSFAEFSKFTTQQYYGSRGIQTKTK